jgi:exodeoxyribonuclease-3
MLRVVSHTPIECEKLDATQREGGWIDAMRLRVPEPAKLYTWWSYRSPDWEVADKGRRLDHIWLAPALADRLADMRVFKHLRGWLRPSDHVPVTAALDV